VEQPADLQNEDAEEVEQPADLQNEDAKDGEADKKERGDKEEMRLYTAPLSGLPRITYREVEEVMQNVGHVAKKKRGRPRKNGSHKGGGQQEAISPGPSTGSVADGGVGECMDPEGNGVSSGRG
jgi:hypothetical protein